MTDLNLIVVMGVSGSGKSTLAQLIASNLGYQYIEADDFHSEQAKAQMEKNIPLTDDIREPWLLRIIHQLALCCQNKQDVVLAYSGLKAKHRAMLRGLNYQLHYILLDIEASFIEARLASRSGHFARAGLLQSQFSSMEMPTLDEKDITVLNANQTPIDLMTQSCQILLGN